MENLGTRSSPKTGAYAAVYLNSPSGVMSFLHRQETFRLNSRSKGQLKERVCDKIKSSQKFSIKEQTKPMEIKLHTQVRAVRRAGFNDLVALKLHFIEQQRKQEEKLQKMIEEEEVRMLRKEMIPKAQLMPFFDKPFFPQRSSKPLTVPREPCFHIVSSKCWRCIFCRELYSFGQPQNQAMKPIK